MAIAVCWKVVIPMKQGENRFSHAINFLLYLLLLFQRNKSYNPILLKNDDIDTV